MTLPSIARPSPSALTSPDSLILSTSRLQLQRYSFYPTLINSTAPLSNPRLTGNGGVVAVRNLFTQVRSLDRFFATVVGGSMM